MIYQILVILILIYFGGQMIGKEYNLVTTNPRNEGKVFTDTFIFHTFFMMTMFNQMIARTVDKDEPNIFKALPSNLIFWIIWILEMGIQHFMLFWSSTSVTGAAILGMAPIGMGLQIIAVVIGAFSIVIHVIHVKFIPVDKFIELDKKIGIEEMNGQAAGLIDKICSCLKSRVPVDDDDYERMDSDGNRSDE